MAPRTSCCSRWFLGWIMFCWKLWHLPVTPSTTPFAFGQPHHVAIWKDPLSNWMNMWLDLPACFARVKRCLKMDLAIITRSTAAIIRSTGSSKNMETCGHKTAFWCFLHFLHCRDDRHYTIYKSLEGPFDLTNVPIEFLTSKQKARGAVPWTLRAIRITWISWWKCNRRPGSFLMSRLPVWFPKRIDVWISFLARCFFTRKGQGFLGDFDGNLLRYNLICMYV